MLENSERWMIELEPHLELSADQLEPQLRNEDIKELTLYRVQSLEGYFESLTPNFERQFKEAFDTEHRYVVSINENHEYSGQEIKEIFIEIDGIKNIRDLHDWLLR